MPKAKRKPQTFGEVLRAARIAAGLNQYELAGLTGIKQNNISDFETGKIGNPTLKTLTTFGGALKIKWGIDIDGTLTFSP